MQPIPVVVADGAGEDVLVAVQGPRPQRLAAQRVRRQPHARPGVVQPVAEFVAVKVLIPLLAAEGVVIVRVGPVAVRREQLPVGIVAVVVRGLALLLGDADYTDALGTYQLPSNVAIP